MSAITEGIGAQYRTLWGIETGNLMQKTKASYLRAGAGNWRMGIAILEIVDKTLTPTLIPIEKDGSFVALGKRWTP